MLLTALILGAAVANAEPPVPVITAAPVAIDARQAAATTYETTSPLPLTE